MKHPLTALLEGAAAFAGLFSERTIAAAAGVLGAIWWHVLRYRRRIILDNLRTAFPNATERQHQQLGRGAVTHLMHTLLEFLRIPKYLRDGFGDSVRFEGLEHYLGARARGKGLLVLTGHLGSFEFCVTGTAHLTRPVSLVVKPFPAGVNAFIDRVRTSSGLSTITAKGAMKPLLSALKRGETVVFVLDQNATRSIGVFVDFFGRPACTMSSLAAVALRTGAPVVAATIYRKPDGTHVLRVDPEIPLEQKSTPAETIVHMTQVYTRVIEDAIRAHPEQWFWTHKRWRTRPVPEPLSSAANIPKPEEPAA